jgi:hypothetical protein
MDKHEFMFNYYEETGEWLLGRDLEKAYEAFLKKENDYINSMIGELKND